MLEFTRQQLEEEIAEKTADLQSLIQARDLLWNRCVYTRDNSSSRISRFDEWAGTHALMNSFDVFIHNSTRLVEDLKDALAEVPVEKPRLRLVKDGQ